jgi:hypothetical protein
VLVGAHNVGAGADGAPSCPCLVLGIFFVAAWATISRASAVIKIRVPSMSKTCHVIVFGDAHIFLGAAGG